MVQVVARQQVQALDAHKQVLEAVAHKQVQVLEVAAHRQVLEPEQVAEQVLEQQEVADWQQV